MQLELHVYRKWETLFSVCGELCVNTVTVMYTLEPARLNPVNPGHPCIPAGRYRVKLTHSPHLGYVCPELQDVPGRSNIRIHIANVPREVEGCTAVGTQHHTDAVLESTIAFKQLMRVLAMYEEIWVTYHDGPPFQEEEKDGQRESEVARGKTAESGGASPGI